MRLPGLGDLPLFWKLLVPFLALILVLGVLGAFFIVRDLSARAQVELDQELARRALDARSVVRDHELYLLESVNLAANLEGMSQAIAARDEASVRGLLRSVIALKDRLGFVVAADPSGRALARLPGAAPRAARWTTFGVVARAARSDTAEGVSGVLKIGGESVLAMAAPVCAGTTECSPAGVVIVGISLRDVTARATAQRSGSSVAVYDTEGGLLTAAGRADWRSSPPSVPSSGLIRRPLGPGVTAAYSALELGGRRQGTIAVSLPSSHVSSAARGAGLRFALVLLATMAGVVAVGALLSRAILAQVRPLVATNRALGSGDLDARAPVVGRDELAELAAGVNQMADKLQASVQTLEQRVEERTAEVRRLLAERSDFFAGLSHELRTPIAVVLSHADMLSEPGYEKTQRWSAQAGKTLKDSGEQLLSVVNDILELAKAEAGGIEIHAEPVRLEAVVKDVRRTIVGLAKAGGHQLSVDVPRSVPPVLADRARLRQVLLNLIDNATKYTPPGGRIELNAAVEGDAVSVRVMDTGVGIPSEAAARIFEPFYRVESIKPQLSRPSSGLGLALTKLFVEAQGGTIGVAPRPGGGSTFTFTLPLATVDR